MNPSRARPLTTGDRLRKLRAMPPGELWMRLRYRLYCRAERSRFRSGSLKRPAAFRDALVPEIARGNDWQGALVDGRRGAHRRFFAGLDDLDAIRDAFTTRFAAERSQARMEGARVLRGELSFFGAPFQYGQRIDWHADPVSRAEWPRLYHRDVPVDGGDVGFGDVKHVWELSRHQFLIDLAKVWMLDRDASYGAAARAFVFDWRAQNPVGTGVAWSCALEPAFRVLSWMWTYFMTLDDPQLDTEDHVAWLEGFHDHGWFLYRHLEYYTSPFNHLIGEACALYCLGTLFPEFIEAPKWRSHAREILHSRLAGQFYSDGGSCEQSAFYHHATTGFYLLAAVLGRRNGDEFGEPVWRAIERAIEFSMMLQQPDGTTPRIGGADDGKPIRLQHLPLWDFRPYQAIGAALFGRGDFKASAGQWYEDAFWLLGHDGGEQFDHLETEPPPTSRVLTSSGYVVARDRWSPEGDYLCFDCGEQAAGLRRDGIPSAAHGHADCLSIIVWRRGRPVLADSGLYCYNGPKAWQDHFRETAAHNTVRLDGRDQAVHINKMAWSHTYRAKLEGYELDAQDSWMVASHDGYRLLERGAVIHRRAVWVRSRGYIVVCDFLEGSGSHDVELTYQFAPGELEVHGAHACFERRVSFHWFAARELMPRLYRGGPTPDGGWIAPSLGVKSAAPRLVLAAQVECPTTIVSIVSDTVDVSTVGSMHEPGREMIRISGNDWTDCLLVKGYRDTAAGDLCTDGYAAVWREERGGLGLVPDGQVGGTFQRP
jgi:hypothetical protein